jgi:RNA-splicing ligase RtcB
MINVNGKYSNAVIYTDVIEPGAIDQITNLCNNECSKDSKIAIMPDVHEGNGCTIGTTMTITDKIVPNLVGVDIGCGMLCYSIKSIDIDFDKFDHQIRRSIPTGFHSRKTIHERSSSINIYDLKCKDKLSKSIDTALYQLGTLGGGNHFIEIDKDSNNQIYLVIHSGSRNLGKQVAEYYQNLAISKCQETRNKERINIIESCKNVGDSSEIESKLNSLIPLNKDLAYLTGEDMLDYLFDMNIVQHYASLNRQIMLYEILRNYPELNNVNAIQFETIHNYINMNDMILRKGAVSAHKEKLIIPMNMRDGSLICIGKDNKSWNYSAPHGAGRIMGRREAKRTFNLEDFKTEMKGIYSTSISKNTIDESPFAYKPMEEITRYIGDTVDIIACIKPIYNFKDDSKL